MKAWFKSKTIWINALTFAASALMLLSQQEWLSQDMQTFVILGISAVNIVLRALTKQALSVR